MTDLCNMTIRDCKIIVMALSSLIIRAKNDDTISHAKRIRTCIEDALRDAMDGEGNAPAQRTAYDPFLRSPGIGKADAVRSHLRERLQASIDGLNRTSAKPTKDSVWATPRAWEIKLSDEPLDPRGYVLPTAYAWCRANGDWDYVVSPPDLGSGVYTFAANSPKTTLFRYTTNAKNAEEAWEKLRTRLWKEKEYVAAENPTGLRDTSSRLSNAEVDNLMNEAIKADCGVTFLDEVPTVKPKLKKRAAKALTKKRITGRETYPVYVMTEGKPNGNRKVGMQKLHLEMATLCRRVGVDIEKVSKVVEGMDPKGKEVRIQIILHRNFKRNVK